MPRSVRRFALLLVLLLLTTGALALSLLRPLAVTVDVGAPGDAYLARNFFLPEQAGGTTFRWSGPNSALQIPGVAADALILSLRLAGGAPEQPVSLYPPGGAGGSLVVNPGWRVYHLLVVAPPQPGLAHPRPLGLTAALSRPAPEDPRELGVALDWVRLQPLRAPALPGALGLAGRFVWALALVAAAVWLALQALAPGRHALARTVALVAPAALGLVLWAWADLYGLLWLLPLQVGPLAAATAAVAAAGAATRLAPHAGRLGSARALRLWPAALAVLGHVALIVPLAAAWRGAAALAILLAPGWLLTRWALAREPERAARAALSLSGSMALLVLILLASAALPGGLAPWRLILLCDALLALGAVLLWRAPAPPPAGAGRAPGMGVALLLIMLLAAALRLPSLGAAELHDDEASVLIAASQLVGGRAEVLLTQLKGPAQILLPTGPLALTGQLTELSARLPFALAGLGVVLVGFALAGRLAGPQGAVAAIATALILACDGLQIAFARIVQYQSLVSLLVLAACWCCWRFYEGVRTARRHLVLAALFVAVALLGHYDAIYVLLPLAWLVFAGARRRGWGLIDITKNLAWPGLLGGALLAAFYVPFVMHPHFGKTVAHLGERTGQGGAGWVITNNLVASYGLVTFYNHPVQVWLVGGLALSAVGLWLAWSGLPRPALWAALVLAGLAIADLLRGPEAALLLRTGLAPLALSALALGLLCFTPAVPAGVRVTALWLSLTWVAMIFLIAQPRTHVYVIGLPVALLAGLGAAALARPLQVAPRLLRGALAGGALLAALIAGLHQQSLFLRQQPEYQRVYPAARMALLGGPAANPLDPAARFGFPSVDGWKAVGELYRSGVLHGALASNQSSEVLAWYLGGYRRCGREPDFYLIALAAANPAIPAGYHRFGTIQAEGNDQLAIYSREPPAEPQRIALEPLIAAFDARPISPIPAPAEACS